jgi:hypothetical protein
MPSQVKDSETSLQLIARPARQRAKRVLPSLCTFVVAQFRNRRSDALLAACWSPCLVWRQAYRLHATCGACIAVGMLSFNFEE